ncbi:hypothetical protein Desdi_0704 [Desulfitobacterium dichloroeliminans LMG P-21439]|uniref:Uncharacterized protein n=1 Tax=Desulfitobacterium dichloroeliminans (strain LMG P-21439 / DCA1) TaxID=871963 RepID=L0F6E6_DESDL|nr:hypothetical protein [Desulfitobacterium dichloroeliminans]AGA68231.1 hypothetical protein Desdi_0704 [Desulfitobacterium dichloroeliminans LMG P-21439]
MGSLLVKVKEYLLFFLVFLGLIYLFDELWNWFYGDSLIRNAFAVTITIILIDVGKIVCQGFRKKEDSADHH